MLEFHSRWRHYKGFPGRASGKEPACQCRRLKRETQVRSLGREDLLEEAMATLSSILARRILWTEEPGGPPWSLRESDTTEAT